MTLSEVVKKAMNIFGDRTGTRRTAMDYSEKLVEQYANQRVIEELEEADAEIGRHYPSDAEPYFEKRIKELKLSKMDVTEGYVIPPSVTIVNN